MVDQRWWQYHGSLVERWGLFFLRQAVYDSTSLGTTGLAGNYLNGIHICHNRAGHVMKTSAKQHRCRTSRATEATKIQSALSIGIRTASSSKKNHSSTPFLESSRFFIKTISETKVALLICLRIPRRTAFLDFLPLPCEKRVKKLLIP